MYETSTTINLYTGSNGGFNEFPSYLNLYHFELEHRISKSIYFLAGNGFNRSYFHDASISKNSETTISALAIGAKAYEVKAINHNLYFFTGFEKKFKAIGKFVFSLKSGFRLFFVSKNYLYWKYYMVDKYGVIDYGPYYYESKNYRGYANFPPDFFAFELTPCLEFKRPKTSYYFQTSVVFPFEIKAHFPSKTPYVCFQLGMRLFKSQKGFIDISDS